MTAKHDYFRPSIIFRSSVSDCKKICDELKIDLLKLGLSEEQQELLIQLLDKKKQEIESRYCG